MHKDELIDFEEKVYSLFCDAQIRAPIHLSNGNEDQLIEIFKDIKRTDWVFSTWRSHYHALLHGIPQDQLLQEIMDGHSITIISAEHRFYSSAIVGGVIPIALGTALSIHMKQEAEKVWVFVGDMTSRTGIFHECSQFAMGHDLPITFVIEDNNISVQTDTRKCWGDGTDNKAIRYSYKSKYPHMGAGKWVTF